MNIAGEATQWTTPMAADRANRGNRAHDNESSNRGGQANLADDVHQWGTPTSRDHKDGSSRDADVPTNGLLGRQVIHCSLQGQDPTGAESTKPSGRLLNAAFVCWLMGAPWFWTRAEPTSFGAAETASWRCRLDARLLILCGELPDEERELVRKQALEAIQ